MNYGPYTELDLSVGWLFGTEPRPDIPQLDPDTDPRRELETVLLEHLERGPVGVTFSGGRNTGTILAVAQRVARRHGLPDPVPLSLHFGVPETRKDEEAQAAAIEALGLSDTWQRIDMNGRAEILGPLARDGLERHSLLFPANAYWVRPMAERLKEVAGDGELTLMAGHGEAELHSYWPYGPLHQVLARKRRPGRHELRLLAQAAVPHSMRTRRERRRYGARSLPWLRPGVIDRLAELSEPVAWVRWDRTLTFLRARRCESATQRGYEALARDTDVRVAFPRLDDRYLGALIKCGGAGGYGTREELTERLFGDVLPPALKGRTDKIAYGKVFFGAETRGFAERWSGDGLPEHLVDPGVLRGLWMSERYDWRTAALMQLAWLHDHANGRC
jgi:hypothetical protein